MVNFEAIGKVVDSGATLVRMSDYYDLVASIDELLERMSMSAPARADKGFPL